MTICFRNPKLAKFTHARRILAFAICAACTLLVSPSSFAQSSKTGTGNASTCPSMIPLNRQDDPAYLALQGVKCFDAGDFSRAFALYSRAHQIDPNPTLYGAIGRVLHELGVYGLAAVYYNEYLALHDSSDAHGSQLIESRLTQLDEQAEHQAGTIKVTSEPSQATVFMVLPNDDWLELGPTPLQLKVKTGKYQLIVVQDGFYRQKHDVNLRRNGKSVTIQAELVNENATFDLTSRQWRRAGTWTMIAGAPVFITGATLLFMGHDDISTARGYSIDSTGHTLAEQRALNNRGKNMRTWGIVTTSVGTAALITGAILYVKGNNTQLIPQKTTASWTPILGFDQVGVQWNW